MSRHRSMAGRLLRARSGRGSASLDHLVGAREQHGRHLEAKRLGGLEIDDQLELGWLLDWNVGGSCAAQNLVNKIGRASIQLRAVRPIGHETTRSDVLLKGIQRRHLYAQRQGVDAAPVADD